MFLFSICFLFDILVLGISQDIRQLEAFYKSPSNIYFITGKLCRTLKVISVGFLLFFQSKKEHSWSQEKCFFLTLQMLFLVLSYSNFRILNFMTSWNAWAWNKKYILLDSMRSKHSLVMKLASLCNTPQETFLSNISTKDVTWQPVQDLYSFLSNPL